MKYKVGDKVRFINPNGCLNSFYNLKVGEIYTIVSFHGHSSRIVYFDDGFKGATIDDIKLVNKKTKLPSWF